MSLKSYINMLKVAILELCIYIVRYFVGFKMVFPRLDHFITKTRTSPLN